MFLDLALFCKRCGVREEFTRSWNPDWWLWNLKYKCSKMQLVSAQSVVSWRGQWTNVPPNFSLSENVFLVGKFASENTKSLTLREFRGTSEIWATIMSSVGKLQLSAPLIFSAHDAAALCHCKWKVIIPVCVYNVGSCGMSLFCIGLLDWLHHACMAAYCNE